LAVGSQTTCSRYRKGIQHAFIIRELLQQYWGDRVDPEAALWAILTNNSRFPGEDFRSRLGLASQVPQSDLDSWIDLLASVTVRTVQHVHVPLLNPTAGIDGMVAWDPDTRMFIHSMASLAPPELAAFRQQIEGLFEEYRNAYGMVSVIQDLASPSRVEAKVQFVDERFVGLELEDFVEALAPEMLSPYSSPSHQTVAPDDHNWPVDVLLVMFDLGSMQHITTHLPHLFEQSTGESLRSYAFMNDLGKIVGHLIAGVPAGQFFSSSCQLGEEAFYSTVWPLFAESLWHAIQDAEPLPFETTCRNYRAKKAMRIISSPDLEPIKFLFQSSLPDMLPGPTLRGAFNQLSAHRSWSNAALTTVTSGLDPDSGAVIQTQTVVGGNGGQIGHKTRELSARLRSVHLVLAEDESFAPNPDPGDHYLVIDGDWPKENKINLYEAGFQGIFEIGQLSALTEALSNGDTYHQLE
jgi:hypothetical protein